MSLHCAAFLLFFLCGLCNEYWIFNATILETAERVCRQKQVKITSASESHEKLRIEEFPLHIAVAAAVRTRDYWRISFFIESRIEAKEPIVIVCANKCHLSTDLEDVHIQICAADNSCNLLSSLSMQHGGRWGFTISAAAAPSHLPRISRSPSSPFSNQFWLYDCARWWWLYDGKWDDLESAEKANMSVAIFISNIRLLTGVKSSALVSCVIFYDESSFEFLIIDRPTSVADIQPSEQATHADDKIKMKLSFRFHSSAFTSLRRTIQSRWLSIVSRLSLNSIQKNNYEELRSHSANN